MGTVSVKEHMGRPMIHIDGKPLALSAYSPVSGRNPGLFRRQTRRFIESGIKVFFLSLPSAVGTDDFFATPFWVGDTVSSRPLTETSLPLDDMARFVLDRVSDAWFIIRFGPPEPKDWRELHPDQLFVNERGERMPAPSLASKLYNLDLARFSAAVVEHCEGHGWADRIIGYWNGMRMEGTHEPVAHGWLFDHGPSMIDAWRSFLRERYGDVEALRRAHGHHGIDFDNVGVPSDSMLRETLGVAGSAYWRAPETNGARRDYLLLAKGLFHSQFRSVCAAMKAATEGSGRSPILMYDALKQTMMGWSNFGFFDPEYPWPRYYPELMSGSGHMGVTELFDAPGFDALITPHDYQARGPGGIYEPEGMADSAVLRGKTFLCEMDTRTHTGTDPCFPSRDLREFEAVTWRNVATGITRGFGSYWMDVYQDWFADEGMHAVVRRQSEVLRESLDWYHGTVPGIAMILDDGAVLETNGTGAVMNEHVMWEQRLGLARCGVPYRIYQFNDLALDGFPEHRVFFFPNLYRVDGERLALLRERVFRDGRVVVWGPGSGISDGRVIGPGSASLLTGFDFDWLPVDYPRRTLISDFEHPITRGLAEDTLIGGPLSYGPVLFPKDGTPLGLAWTKQGRALYGMAVKDMGGWTSLFTTSTPLPAGLWRGIAGYAGSHVYSQHNDVLMADSTVVALHSLRSGTKRISLPKRCAVWDVIRGTLVSGDTDSVEFRLDAPGTAVFRMS